MNFDLTEDQEMLRDSFARFLDDKSSTEHVRKAAENGGFDAELWQGLAELGAFGIRVPEEAGGLGLGTFDAVVLMEEAGRTLASGPLAEALVAARLLGQVAAESQSDLLESVIGGDTLLTIAFHDIAKQPKQWIAGGLCADAVIARKGGDIVLIKLPEGIDGEKTLASTPVAEIDLGSLAAETLATDSDGLFDASLEEWKLLISAALAGLGRQALLLAAAYAAEREQFGQLIGKFQGVSHPLADRLCDVDGSKLLVYKAIRDLADGDEEAGAAVSLAAWYSATGVARAVSQAIQTFGGYGLSTEYDIHLYNLRAKAWPLVWGDPQLWLTEAADRLYDDAAVSLPEVGDMPIEFDIGEEARGMIAEIDDFMAKNVTDEMREKFHYSWEGWVPELHKKLAEANLLFIGNETLGGRPVGPYAKRAARAAFDRHGYSNPAAGVTEMVGTIIDRTGTDELKDEVLTKIKNGDVITSLGYSEPGSGSDVFAAKTRATQVEDGSWRINGTKMWTSGANLSSYVLMLTRTNTEVPKHKGLTMFIVPLKAEGVEVQPIHTFMDERTNTTFYDDVVVPDSWRLGEIDGGVKTMSAALELEHGGGFGNVMLENVEAAERLCREIDMGDGKLIDRKSVQERLVRARAHVHISHLFENRSAWASVNKKPNLAYGPMAKMYSSERFLDDARDLLDMTAPLSLSKRNGGPKLINQSYRHSHGSRIYGGTSEVHRSMIAERGLGMPRTRG